MRIEMECRRSIVILILSFALIAYVNGHSEILQNADEDVTLVSHRVQRQASSTTPPPKRRPANIFSLFRVLLAETRDDARRAFSDIGRIFSSQFAPSTAKPNTVSSTTMSPSNSTEDGETTTTEAYKITREEFNGILMNNFRGIFRLFGQELRSALKDSNKNVRQFGRELREQVRPYVSR